MSSSSGLSKAVREGLVPLQLGDDETIANYVASVAEDASIERQQKQQDMAAFLVEACGCGQEQADAVVESILAAWDSLRIAEAGKSNNADSSNGACVFDMAQRHNQALQEADEEARRAAALLSEEERQRRQTLVQQYDVEEVELSDEEEAEDGDATKADGAAATATRPLSEKKQRQHRKAASAADLASGYENVNRAVIDSERRKVQEQARTESKAKAARDKADLQTDKQRKEQKKQERQQRAAKGERRR